jgi:hypothetical protein
MEDAPPVRDSMRHCYVACWADDGDVEYGYAYAEAVWVGRLEVVSA